MNDHKGTSQPDHDLDILRAWDADAPPLTDRARNRARARLFAAMEGRPRRARAALPRRPLLRAALASTVAAAATAGVLVAVHQGSPSDDPVRLESVSARTVLSTAAAVERRHEKTVAPRDDQFIYTKEIVKETERKTGRTKTYTDENWQSVDGSKRSWVMEIGHGWWAEPDGKGISWPPTDWTRLKKLPTDPDRLLIAVRDWSAPKPDYDRPVAKDEWANIEFFLSGLLYRVPVMPAGLRPAAYEALGMIPGVKATPGEKDAKGRVGIAISYDGPHALGDMSFLFAPDTYEYLGMRDNRTSNDGRREYVQRSYLDGYAVVDKAKQRP